MKIFQMLCLILVVFSTAAALYAAEVMMATTTSTDNSGLLDYLAPYFEKETGINWKWVAVGTGKALKLGQNCDADVLMVHAPAAEAQFIGRGYGVMRTEFMYNDFVVIGPEEDPAGIKGSPVTEAFKRLLVKKPLFVSRGDDSGTNKKELALWRHAGIAPPKGAPHYLQTGQGMMPTLLIADEKKAYTLTDRGTYIGYRARTKGRQPLIVLVEGDRMLFNQYSVIPVAPAHCPDTHFSEAKKLRDWLISDAAQTLIGSYRLEGKRLFTPNAHRN